MSTFSTNLKLELIGNGEQTGTWGTTTNTNLGTLIEQAITGIQNITISTANYKLTNLNGVSNEARNAVLIVSGTPGAARNILVPNGQTKTYIVVNNTTGGFNIGVQTWSGSGLTGTGAVATIPPSASIQIYCTGSNCYAIAPYTSITATPIVFEGWASGTTLTVTSAPTAPIAVGQTVYNAGILYTTSGFPDNTTIVNQLSGTTGGVGTYTINNASTVGAAAYPQPITALNTLTQIATVDYVQTQSQSINLAGAPTADTATAAAFEASIFGTGTYTGVLIINKFYITGNPISLGQYLNGGTLSDGSFVSAYGTGTAGSATYTGYISGTTLTITPGSVTGTVTTNQYLVGTGIAVGTKIVAGSGLSWTVSISQTAGSATNLVSIQSLGPITAASNEPGWITIQNNAQPMAGSIRSPMLSFLSPLQLTNTLFVTNIAYLLGTLGTQSDEAVDIKGGTIKNVTITGATVNGANIGSNAQGTKTISTAAPFNSSTFLGYISGTTMIVPSVSAGAIVVGQTLTGSGITGGTTVSSLSSNNTSSFTGSISGTTLTVAASPTPTGTIAIGQTITGVGVTLGTVITAGSGLSWTVSASQTVSSTTITGASATWIVTPSQTSGSVTALITTNGYANLTVGVNGDVWYRYS